MNKHLILRSLGALVVAGFGTVGFAQDDEENSGSGERRVRIEITKNENGQKSHVTREFNLNDESQLQDALRELGVLDELNVIGNGENLTINMRRSKEGGLLNDMSLALTLPGDDRSAEPRPYLGVYYGDYNEQCDKENKSRAPVKEGACITGIDDDTPAAKAGLKEGDVIVQFGDKKIANGDALVGAINEHKPGDKVKITYYRGKQKNAADVVLDKREEESVNWNWNGANEAPNSEEMDWDAYNGDNWKTESKPFLGVMGSSVEGDKPGVKISEVVEGSAAEKMGLKEGDVIRRINGDAVEDFGDLSEKIGDMEPEQDVKVDITREGKDMTMDGTLGKQKNRSFSFNYAYPPTLPGSPEAPELPVPPMPAMPSVKGKNMSPEDLAEYERDMKEYERDVEEHARDMSEYARDRDERRREMDQLRAEMDHLRHDLRGDVTREMRVTIKDVELNKEETDLLKNKGVANLDQPLDLQDVRCYPNPSSDAFHISFGATARGDLNLDVHDTNGERVYHETITGFKGNYERTLDMSDKADGTYFLVITQNGRTVAQKVVKK